VATIILTLRLKEELETEFLSREKSSKMFLILDWSHGAYRDQDGYVHNQAQDTFVHVERPKIRVEIKED
jgi:hypothetical protein